MGDQKKVTDDELVEISGGADSVDLTETDNQAGMGRNSGGSGPDGPEGQGSPGGSQNLG